MISNSGPRRSRPANASTDPVVVGLGRLLLGLGILVLAGVLMVGWLVWCA